MRGARHHVVQVENVPSRASHARAERSRVVETGERLVLPPGRRRVHDGDGREHGIVVDVHRFPFASIERRVVEPVRRLCPIRVHRRLAQRQEG